MFGARVVRQKRERERADRNLSDSDRNQTTTPIIIQNPSNESCIQAGLQKATKLTIQNRDKGYKAGLTILRGYSVEIRKILNRNQNQ